MNFFSQKQSLILLITDAQVQLLHWQSGDLAVLYDYGKSPEDLAAFAEEIRSYQGLPVLIVTDLIEENFRYDTVVHVNGSDQKALLKRKLDFAFRNTAYRRGKVIERETEGRRDDKILLSAISKPESVEAWETVLLDQKFAIQTITSLAYILETFVALRKNTEGSFFLITNLENGNNLRQTFFRNGQMLFSRLTMLTGRDPDQIGDEIHRETTQLRQYFERIQFLTYDAQLCIEVYAAYDDSLLQLESKTTGLNRFEVMDTNILASAKKRGHSLHTSPTHLFLREVLAHKRPANVYAPLATTRFHDLKTVGSYLAFSACLLLLVTLAVNIPVALNIKTQWQETTAFQRQILPLQSQHDALVSAFPAIPASPQEMELVVLTHEKIAKQIHSPVAAMNMISTALAASPGLRLTTIDWSLVERPINTANEFGNVQGASLPPLQGLRETNGMLNYLLNERSQIKIIIDGQANAPRSFREAQDKVVSFVGALAENPGVTVYASRMPTDVRTDISVTTLVTDGENTRAIHVGINAGISPMISIREYNKEDLLLIKGRLLIFMVSVILAGGIFWGASYIENSAIAELRQARNELDNVHNAIATIQADEVTVNNYIDAYRSLQTKGVVGTEDRLQLLELLAQIRTQHELFPVNLNIGQQAELTLPYRNDTAGARQPVKLRSSVLEISFALLHEEDLSRLLDDILASSQFLQPAKCRLSANNASNTNYYYLDKHFTASCAMYWYTFNVSAAAGVQP